jgi:hypothetical protein
MANWQRTLSLRDVWPSNDVRLIARTIAERLRALHPFGLFSLDLDVAILADEFQAIGEDPEADVDDFDGVMERLYDWGDRPLDEKWNGKKVCWIETF